MSVHYRITDEQLSILKSLAVQLRIHDDGSGEPPTPNEFESQVNRVSYDIEQQIALIEVHPYDEDAEETLDDPEDPDNESEDDEEETA